MLGDRNSLTFKWLIGSQIKELDSIVAQQGWSDLPLGALAYAAYDDNGLAGFHVLQMRAHAEPLYVREDMRGKGLSTVLANAVAEFLEEAGTRGFIAIADTPEAEKLCVKFGMKKITSPVYVR